MAPRRFSVHSECWEPGVVSQRARQNREVSVVLRIFSTMHVNNNVHGLHGYLPLLYDWSVHCFVRWTYRLYCFLHFLSSWSLPLHDLLRVLLEDNLHDRGVFFVETSDATICSMARSCTRTCEMKFPPPSDASLLTLNSGSCVISFANSSVRFVRAGMSTSRSTMRSEIRPC